MIKITFSDLLLVYFFIFLLTVAILWFREIWRNKRRLSQELGRRQFFCRNCGAIFNSREYVNLMRCPRCNTICMWTPKDNSNNSQTKSDSTKNNGDNSNN